MALTHAFLKDLLQYIPDDARGEVETQLERLETVPEARQALDNGIKRQSDYSRAMDELRTKEAAVQAKFEEQTAWWEANQPVLEAGRKALAGPASGDPTVDPNKPKAQELPPDVVRVADIEKMFGERELQAMGFSTAVATLAVRHFQEFGEVLDTTALVTEALQAKKPLAEHYQTKFGERFVAKAKEAEDARITAEVEKRVTERMRTQGVRQPYPVAGTPSPLDALTTDKPDPSQFSVEAAADEYAQLVAQRAG